MRFDPYNDVLLEEKKKKQKKPKVVNWRERRANEDEIDNGRGENGDNYQRVEDTNMTNGGG